MEILLQTLYFLLLILSYSLVLLSILQLPFYFVGILFGSVQRLRRVQISPMVWEKITKIEIAFLVIVLLSLFLVLYEYSYRVLPHAEFWDNPLILGFALLYAAIVSRGARSYNPIMREGAAAVPVQVLAILTMIFVGTFAESSLHLETVRYALFSTVGIMLIGNCIMFFKRPSNVRLFEQLDKRHDHLIGSLNKLRQIALMLGDLKNWEITQDAVRELERLNREALAHLRRKRFDEADAAIVQAETEVSHVEQLIKTQLRFSIHEDLKVRIDNAIRDVASLRAEFEEAGLAGESLDHLYAEVEGLKPKIPEIDSNSDDLFSSLQEFRSIFQKIVETKTALRFRRNFGSTVDALFGEVKEGRKQYTIAQALDLFTDSIRETRERLERELENLQTLTVGSSEELVSAYQNLQATILDFHSERAKLANRIDRHWTAQDLVDGKVTAYVPKTCSTRNVNRVAVSVNFGSLPLDRCSFTIDGALVELPNEKVLQLARRSDEDIVAEYIEFVGKRGGLGSISIRPEDKLSDQERVSIPLRVVPSINETIQNSVLIGSIGAGLTGFVFWWFTSDVNRAGVIGAAAGAICSAVPFLWKQFRYLRHVNP